MLTLEHTPAVSAIHPAKALLCVGRILYCAPLRVVRAVAHQGVCDRWKPVRARYKSTYRCAPGDCFIAMA